MQVNTQSSKIGSKSMKVAKTVRAKKIAATVEPLGFEDENDGTAELDEYQGKPLLKMQMGNSDFGFKIGLGKLTCLLKNLSSVRRFVASKGTEC